MFNKTALIIKYNIFCTQYYNKQLNLMNLCQYIPNLPLDIHYRESKIMTQVDLRREWRTYNRKFYPSLEKFTQTFRNSDCTLSRVRCPVHWGGWLLHGRLPVPRGRGGRLWHGRRVRSWTRLWQRQLWRHRWRRLWRHRWLLYSGSKSGADSDSGSGSSKHIR